MNGEDGFGNAAGTPLTTPGARNLSQLIRQGGKLGVLGVEEPSPSKPNAARWWHVLRPGSWAAPDAITKMTYGRAVCGRIVVSNGYAADWRPPEGSICPACNERL
jgi:hypothetical protein